MRAMQKEKLFSSAEKGCFELIWHDSIYDIPRNPAVYSMAIAHEFFDALPVHVIKVDRLSFHC
jgi:NADH dehydrogenase [ubiquinone] 1 alpha subcomplex assembly factor 7